MNKIKKEIIDALIYKENNPEKSNTYIYTKFNISKKTFSKYLESTILEDIKNKEKYVKSKDYFYELSERDILIINAYKNGMNAYEIRNKYGTHIERWKEILDLLNISTEKRYKLNWNRNAFTEIKTEEDAYFLGFILADGYLNEKKYALKIKINEKDIDFLEKFCKYMMIDYNHIKTEIHNTTKNKLKSVYFSDIKFYKNLEKYGLFQAKSGKEIFYKKMNDKLKKHYIRGIIDGDGYITKDSSSIGVCGSEDVLKNIDEFLVKKLSLNINNCPKRLRYDETSHIYRLNYSGKNAKKIIIYLYENTNIYLNRKYELAHVVF